MNIKNSLILIVGVAFCAIAPLTRAQSPQICDAGTGSVYIGDGTADNGAFFDTAVGYQALMSDVGSGNTAVGNIAL